MPFVTANGIQIAYEENGAPDGAPMLLIMGFGAQLTAWPQPLCDKLAARGFRVIRFDNRDAGLSQKVGADPPYSLSDMAADAAGVLDALKIDKAHIVGASMGGLIGQLFAANYPQRTLSFTCIMSSSNNPGIPGPSAETIAAMSAPGPDPRVDWDGYVKSAIARSRVTGSPAYPPDEAAMAAALKRDFERNYTPASIAGQMAAVRSAGDHRPKLRAIRAPTLVLSGENDPLAPVAAARDIAANIAGAEVMLVPGMGHDLPAALHDMFVDAIARTAARANA